MRVRALTARRILPLILGTLLSVLSFRLLDPVTFQRFQQSIFRASWYARQEPDSPRALAQHLLGKTHVAVFDKEAFHEEVHGAVLWTLAQFPAVQVSFYRPPWRWEFAKCIQSWWTTQPLDPNSFFDDLEQDKSIRHVFMPTIDFSGRDWKDVSPHLQRIWDGRKPEERFNIVGMRHWGTYDLTREVAWWAERDSISFIALGDHVSLWLERQQRDRAKDKKRFGQAQGDGLRRMRVRTFVPIFPPDKVEKKQEAPEAEAQVVIPGDFISRSTLDMALIQSGQWDEGHRGMNGIFEELQTHLEGESTTAALIDADFVADASIWGYDQNADGNFVPAPNATSRFTIKLLGAGGLGIPKPLKAMFKHERRLSYPAFFDRVHEADLTLPAFGKEKYGENRASSTMGVSATAMTPLLVTQDLASAYG